MPANYNYHEETEDLYAYIEVEFTVVDANGDEYARDFTVMNTSEGLAILCPDCGEHLVSNADGEYGCAKGHLLYRIENHEEPERMINDAFRDAVEQAEKEEKEQPPYKKVDCGAFLTPINKSSVFGGGQEQGNNMKMSEDKVYFACKYAFQTLSGNELTAKLKEIFTPEIVAEMEQKNRQSKIYNNATDLISALHLERSKYKDETRKQLNNEYARRQRDKNRVKNYGARPKTNRIK